MADQRLLAGKSKCSYLAFPKADPGLQVTSWAIVDYFLRPKPAYFTIARELRPFTVGMTRKEKKTYADESTAAFFEIETVLEIWGTNATLEEKKVTLEVASFELDSEWTDTWSREVALPPNASTELWKGELPGQPKRTKASEVPRTIVVSARLLDADGTVLGRYSNWCVPKVGFIVIAVADVICSGLNPSSLSTSPPWRRSG